MKKVVLVLALLLMLGAAALPAAAVPTADLTALARVFPADTAIFAAIRTDEAYIETLDSVIARINQVLPRSQRIDSLSGSLAPVTDMMRAWLGDTAALGINAALLLDGDDDNDFLAATLAVELTDSALAVDFMRGFLSSQVDFEDSYTVEESGGVTVFRPKKPRPRLDGVLPFMFTENYMAVGNLEPVMNRMARLDSVPAFTETMSALPLGDYNIALYFDTQALFDAQLTALSELGGMAEMDEMLEQFADVSRSLGGLGMGFTILDERSLIIDMVSLSNPEAVAEALGLEASLVPEAQPIDLSFARFIPAGTPIVTHVTNLAGAYDTLLDALRAGALLGSDQDITAEALAEIESGIAGIEFAVRGLTGLDLKEDILSWMTSDLAIWVGLTPQAAEATSLFQALAAGLPVDFGILVDARPNPDSAAALVNGLKNAFDFAARQLPAGSVTSITVRDETIGGSPAVSISIADPSLPFPIELVTGASADVFVIGTRAAAEAALNARAGLDSDPAFQEALRYALADTVQLQYLAGAPLAPLFDLLQGGSSSSSPQLGEIISLISSSSISSATADGAAYIRLVLTLAA
jgi:hypothetical protein